MAFEIDGPQASLDLTREASIHKSDLKPERSDLCRLIEVARGSARGRRAVGGGRGGAGAGGGAQRHEEGEAHDDGGAGGGHDGEGHQEAGAHRQGDRAGDVASDRRDDQDADKHPRLLPHARHGTTIESDILITR